MPDAHALSLNAGSVSEGVVGLLMGSADGSGHDPEIVEGEVDTGQTVPVYYPFDSGRSTAFIELWGREIAGVLS